MGIMETPNYEVSKILNHLMESLQVLTRSSRVVGDPITIGDFTIVPLIQIGFGFGGGGGGGEETAKNIARGSGEGGGAGGSIQPVALLVLHQQEIHLYALPTVSAFANPLGSAQEIVRKSGLSELVASIPDIVSKLKKKKEADA
jgi:uncharacterized spore protein YtfJ